MKKYLPLILITLCVLIPVFFVNAGGINLQLNYPKIPGVSTTLNDIASGTPPADQLGILAQYFYYFIVTISGIAAFVMIVAGGIQYLTSAGNPSQMGDAKDKIFKALIGVLIILSSWLVLNFINPDLVNLKISGPSNPGNFPDITSILSTSTNPTTFPNTPTIGFTVNGTDTSMTVSPGSQVTLAWNAPGYNSCQASASPSNSNWSGTKPLSGSNPPFALNVSTVFTLICYQTGNLSITKSISVGVGSGTGPSPSVNLTVYDESINNYTEGPISSSETSFPDTTIKFKLNTSYADACSAIAGNSAPGFIVPSGLVNGTWTMQLVSNLYPATGNPYNFQISCVNNSSGITTNSNAVRVTIDYPGW